MHVAQFLDALRFRPHVETIVRGTESFLPDVLRTVVEETALFRIAFPREKWAAPGAVRKIDL